jgi:xanthine dehydrogenase accessory factor
MQHLDLQVIEQAVAWSLKGKTVWLCTVLSTFGSSPREPGSLLAALDNGEHIGSLSGGCVEEDFLERLQRGEFEQAVSVLPYGDPNGPQGSRITLPCGGILKVLIERLPAKSSVSEQLIFLLETLRGRRHLLRKVDLFSGYVEMQEDDGVGPRIVETADGRSLLIRFGPSARLIIAGISPVSIICAEFARTLGFEVIVCDPREDAYNGFDVSGVELRKELPSQYIAANDCHHATAIVALTHDPRIDDLTVMEAVRTSAFYIGVMGSQRTSKIRAERLRRVAALSDTELERLHMPIGLALGSKTPAEIALAALADIVRVYRGAAT